MNESKKLSERWLENKNCKLIANTDGYLLVKDLLTKYVASEIIKYGLQKDPGHIHLYCFDQFQAAKEIKNMFVVKKSNLQLNDLSK